MAPLALKLCTINLLYLKSYKENENTRLMKTHFYLARHGQTLWNTKHKFQGQLDSALTELGQQQSKKIANMLINNSIDCIVSSTLGRALSSAQICQDILKVPVTHCELLMERHLGTWQGLYVNKVKSQRIYNELLHQYTDLSPTNGESAITCASRIYQSLETLATCNINKNVLVITHGEALRCFLAKLGHELTGNAYELFDNGSIFKVTYDHNNQSFIF